MGVVSGIGKCAEFAEKGCKFIFISSECALILKKYAAGPNVRNQAQFDGRSRLGSGWSKAKRKELLFLGSRLRRRGGVLRRRYSGIPGTGHETRDGLATCDRSGDLDGSVTCDGFFERPDLH